MKKCPYCGHMNEDSARGCKRCSAGFPDDKQDRKPKAEDEPETDRVLKRKTRS